MPRIRSGLLRHSLDNQVLVYDSRDDRVHLLDPTTACVLELLEEGGWTGEGITAELAVRLNVTPSDGFLRLALDELRKADLLDEKVTTPSPIADANRRELVRKLAMAGAAALLMPTVVSLTATKGYAQGTPACVTVGITCPSGTSGGDRADPGCCSGLCDCNPAGNNCDCT